MRISLFNPLLMLPFDLARAYLENKDLKQAILYYQKALDLAKGKEIDTQAITWGMTFIKGLKNPLKLSLVHLKRLAGDYGPRHIVLKEGDLYYLRDNADSKEYKKLIPISKDTFIMEYLINFRLRFNIPKTGAANKVTGITEGGNEDVSVRTKKKQLPYHKQSCVPIPFSLAFLYIRMDVAISSKASPRLIQ